MRRGVQWFAIALGASAALLGYREASAAARVSEASVARVCVAGLRLDLAGGAAARGAEEGRLVGDAICAVPSVPRGLPGERLLSASSASGDVIAHRVSGPPAAALEAAVEALAREGWRETAASRLARGRGAVARSAAMISAGGFLVVTAVPARSRDASVVLAAALARRGEAGR